ncbi:MAG TPA: ABC transporter permease [Gemmatimonadaceae bacterium]|nr:ABC transporter permease [Gemmatimonadaceae bacterium]
MSLLANDLRLSIRRLLRSPGFALVAVTTLALGIGANTSIFSVVDAALIRPLPYPTADRVVRIHSPSVKGPSTVSPPDFLDWRAANTVFDGMGAYSEGSYALTGNGVAEELDAAGVTQDFFQVLRRTPALGRTFAADDEVPGVHVVVLSDGLWRRRFGADSGCIGRSIVLDAVPYTVIGVMPPDFEYPAGDVLWTPQPFTAHDLATQRGAHYLSVIARLRPGATLDGARTEMQTIWTRLARTFPTKDSDRGGQVVSLRESLVGKTGPALLVLWAAVGVVLLIACANVANLLLARAVTRQREMAIRSALGASRLDLMRASIADALLLALLGGAAGVGLAGWGVRALIAIRPDNTSIIAGATLDMRVLLVSLAISLGAGLAAGLLPTFQIQPRRDVQRAKRVLAITELALAVVLLTSAGLLLRTFAALRSVDLGFTTDNRVTFDVALPDARYESREKRAAFLVALTNTLRALPGVRSVGATTGLPLSGYGYSMSAYALDGVHLSDDEQDRLSTQLRVATPGYFATMGIPLESGRWFTDADRLETQPVAVVNEAAAKLIAPGKTPIGHSITFGTTFGLGDNRVGGTIVGIVGNTHEKPDLTTPVPPMIYLAHAQFPLDYWSIVASTASPSIAPMRAALEALDPDVPMFHPSTMAHLADEAVSQSRFVMLLLEIFATVAITMAMVGLYGVIAYSVGERTREIGVRMALGARSEQVLGLVIKDGVATGIIGVAVGLVGSLAATKLLQGLLFGVGTTDLLTLGVTCVLVGVATLAATWLPAWRASHIDPVVAIKSD